MGASIFTLSPGRLHNALRPERRSSRESVLLARIEIEVEEHDT